MLLVLINVFRYSFRGPTEAVLPFPNLILPSLTIQQLRLLAFIREGADDTDTPGGLPPSFGGSETRELSH